MTNTSRRIRRSNTVSYYSKLSISTLQIDIEKVRDRERKIATSSRDRESTVLQNYTNSRKKDMMDHFHLHIFLGITCIHMFFN